MLIVLTATTTYLVIQHTTLNNKNNEVIPIAIQQRIAFQIFAPNSSNTTWTISNKQVSYNSQQGILSITVTTQRNTLIMDEQQTPQIFTNIPQYYPALLSKLNQYGQFTIGLGTVTLTKPTELHGEQTAVLNSGGTLIFVRPTHNLSISEWTDYFNSLIVLR